MLDTRTGRSETRPAKLHPGNAASIRMVEKSGFHYEGRLRSYLELDGRRADAVVYSLLASDL